MPTILDPDINDYLDESGWAATTLTVANSYLARWERFLLAQSTPIADADHRDLRAFLSELESSGVRGTTRHKYWQRVSLFYKWAATSLDDGGPAILERNPMARVKAPTQDEPSVRTATPDIAAVLVNHYHAEIRRYPRDTPRSLWALRNAAIVSLLMRAGVRSCEAGGLELSGLVRDERGKIVACEVPAAFAKTRHSRLVPLTDETPRLLERYLRRRGSAPGPLFLARESRLGKPAGRMTPAAVQGVVRRAAKVLGITVSAHDFRRGWAVTAADRGVERGWIKISGGWKRDAMLDRYLGPDRQRIATEQFHIAAGEGRALRIVREIG